MVLLLVLLGFFPFVSSAHYVVGYVEDALDFQSPNNYLVVLWNPENGVNDNVTDVIGPNGNSGYDNTYMIDCEMLETPCSQGDVLNLKVFDYSGLYVGRNLVNVTVSTLGYDLVLENLTMNSPVSFLNMTLDDDFDLVLDEIDLIANSEREVFCSAIVVDYDGDSIFGVYSELYDFSNSYFGDFDDNNYHYSNSSCFVNYSYGSEGEIEVVCSYKMKYYANSEDWICEIVLNDSYVQNSGNDVAFVNPLLAIEVVDEVNFSVESPGDVSMEENVVVNNVGNIDIDLGLQGYGDSLGDDLAMSCSGDEDIPIFYKKYNLISSISGNLTLGDFESNYVNLTSASVVNDFNLTFRKNDFENEAFKSTFWRIYVPETVSGLCEGNIIFSAVMSS